MNPDTDDLLRAQLRAMYVWNDRTGALELHCREKRRPLVFTAGRDLAAEQLQEVIGKRADEARARHPKRSLPFELLPVDELAGRYARS